MNERIKRFIEKQQFATICCTDESGAPYCFNASYAFDGDKGLLCYKSSNDTRHSQLLIQNPAVAGTILPGKVNMLLIKGIQFQGKLLTEPEIVDNAANIYYAKLPGAKLVSGNIWVIQIDNIKYTDNRIGFGAKLCWSRK